MALEHSTLNTHSSSICRLPLWFFAEEALLFTSEQQASSCVTLDALYTASTCVDILLLVPKCP